MIDLAIDHLHAAEVGDPNRLASALATGEVSHHHPLDVRQPTESRHAAHQVDLRALLEHAGVDVDVLGHEPVLDVGQRDAEGVEPIAVQPHPDFLLPAARDPDLRDAGQLFEAGGDLAPGQPAQFGQVGPAVRGH